MPLLHVSGWTCTACGFSSSPIRSQLNWTTVGIHRCSKIIRVLALLCMARNEDARQGVTVQSFTKIHIRESYDLLKSQKKKKKLTIFKLRFKMYFLILPMIVGSFEEFYQRLHFSCFKNLLG